PARPEKSRVRSWHLPLVRGPDKTGTGPLKSKVLSPFCQDLLAGRAVTPVCYQCEIRVKIMPRIFGNSEISGPAKTGTGPLNLEVLSPLWQGLLSALDFLAQPGLGKRPQAAGRAQRDAQDFGDLPERQSREIAEEHQFRRLLIGLGQL